MSLLPKEASFEELVQDVFLAFRGAGLMLSPLDAELVSSWAESGVPFEVVAWGIRRAAEKAGWDARPGDQALRSVRRCRRDVDAEIRKYLDRSAGATSPGASSLPRISEHARRKLRAGLRQTAAEHPQLENAVAQLLHRMAGADLSADAVELVPNCLIRALPFGERLSILREADAQMRSLADGASPRGRKLARRVHRAALLRKRLALPSFW